MVSVVVCTDLSGKEPHRQVGVGRVVTSGSLGGVMVSVVVCTDISGKEPHRQVGVGRVVTSGSPDARDVGLIPALGAIFPIFIHPPPQHWRRDQDPVQAMCCIFVEPTTCVCLFM